MGETTDDAFLGGRLQLLQPKDGYRGGIDPVLLAAATTPKQGARVLELGCGAGIALYCLQARVPDLSLTGVELHSDHADLARRNAQRNGIDARIVEADITALPADLRHESFDLILANPPFFDRTCTTPSGDASREAGRGEDTPLQAWADVAAKRLAPKGQAVFIQRAERLLDLLMSLQGILGSIEILPIVSRAGRDARLVIVRARKGGRAEPRLAAPLVLHRGETHADGDTYTPEVSAVLRQAAALPRF